MTPTHPYDEAPPGGIPAGPHNISTETMMRTYDSYSTTAGSSILGDPLDLVEVLLDEAEAMSPAYGWDAEAGELAYTDPYEYEADENALGHGGWDDPAAAAAVLEQTVIADARLTPHGGPDHELATVTALAPPRRHTDAQGVAA